MRVCVLCLCVLCLCVCVCVCCVCVSFCRFAFTPNPLLLMQFREELAERLPEADGEVPQAFVNYHHIGVSREREPAQSRRVA